MKLLKDQTALFSYIDSDFKNWNVDEGVQISGVELKSKKLEKDSTFKEMFNPETDCVSQEDVIKWCEENKDNYKNYEYFFFLLKTDDNRFFVARVSFDSEGLKLGVFGFSRADVWDAEYAVRLVVPATSKTVSLNSSPSIPLTLESAIKICKENGLLVYEAK